MIFNSNPTLRLLVLWEMAILINIAVEMYNGIVNGKPHPADKPENLLRTATQNFQNVGLSQKSKMPLNS